MSLDTIVDLTITVDSKAPSQEGFGTPLLLGYHTAWLDDLVREYSQPSEMLEDGFDTEDNLYQAASVVKMQEPSPNTFKIGRRVTALTQLIEIVPTKTTEGFVYKGVIGGKALNVVNGAGATLLSAAAALVAAINTLAVGVVAANDSPASVTGTVVGPWDLEPGDTLLVSVDADVPGSPDTATFTGTAAARESTNTESTPFNLDNGFILNVKIDGGPVQAITFVTANFANIDTATAEEVAAVINAQLVGGRATASSSGTKVTITSDKRGSGSHVEVTGGTANAAGALNFATAVVNGTGNVASIDAVTFLEAKTVIEAATDATVTSEGGALKLSSSTTGASSKLLVAAGSTADDDFGLSNATHTGAAASTTVTCTATTPGKVVDYKLQKGMTLRDVTADTTTGAELAEILAEDDDWYGLSIIDSSSKATSILAAAFEQTQRKICLVQTCDDEAADANVEDDVLSSLVASSYSRTGGVYHRPVGGVEWLAAGVLAGHLTTNPGSATLAFKNVVGVTFDKLTTGQESAILAKNGSHYTRTGGLNILFEGKAGSGDFLDTMRGIDWLYARIREAVLGFFAAATARGEKVPFTDSGVDGLRTVVMGVLSLGVKAKLLKDDPKPEFTAPLVKTVSAANRINRILPDCGFTGELAGAIHRTKIRGLIAI